MIYRGKVKGTVVVLPADVRLPEGCEVLVQPIPPATCPIKPGDGSFPLRSGVPVFPASRSPSEPVDLKTVNRLRDELL